MKSRDPRDFQNQLQEEATQGAGGFRCSLAAKTGFCCAKANLWDRAESISILSSTRQSNSNLNWFVPIYFNETKSADEPGTLGLIEMPVSLSISFPLGTMGIVMFPWLIQHNPVKHRCKNATIKQEKWQRLLFTEGKEVCCLLACIFWTKQNVELVTGSPHTMKVMGGLGQPP